MAIDYTAPGGQVRLIIADIDESNLLLTSAQISGYLALEGGNVKLAAAAALDAIASSEALVSKKITSQGMSTDGPAVAGALRAQATSLRQQVADGLGDDGVGFSVVDFDPHLGYAGYVP